MEPKIVSETPPRFRVRRVAHGDTEGVEDQLELAEKEGYEFGELYPSPNGDVILIFRRQVEA